jgi:hypothetical protein
MTDRFDGDPRLFIDSDGAYLDFQGGQPVMDAGIENLALISLHTGPGWWGNALIDRADRRIGSDFEKTASGTITLSKLNDIRQSAERALSDPAFGRVTTTVQNPQGNRIDVINRIEPPGQDIQELTVSRYGLNWIAQSADPAHRRTS